MDASSAAVQRRPWTRTWLWWVPAVLAAVAQSYAALSRPVTDRLVDLHVYLGAVTGLRQQRSLYDFITVNDAPFTYPPFAGLLMFPLGRLPEWPVGVVWTVGTVAIVGALAVLVASAAVRAGWLPARSWPVPALATAVFLSAPVSSNLRFGQVSVALALLVLVDVLALARSRYHGVLIGIAAAIKLTPLIFIPMLWLIGRRRASLTSAAVYVAATALAWLVLPCDSVRFWATEIWQVSRVGHIATGGNQSVNGAMLRMGVADRPGSVLMLALAAVLAGLALWRAAGTGRRDPLAATILVGAASLAVSPVSWTHHQVWLVLAALLPVRGPRWVRRTWTALPPALMILPVTSLGSHLPGPLGAVLGESRLLLAVVVAVAVPLVTGPGGGRATVDGPAGPVGTVTLPAPRAAGDAAAATGTAAPVM